MNGQISTLIFSLNENQDHMYALRWTIESNANHYYEIDRTSVLTTSTNAVASDGKLFISVVKSRHVLNFDNSDTV